MNEKQNELFSERLREMRKEKGMSQEAFAEKFLDNKVSTLGKWEQGNFKNIHAESVVMLSDVFGCDADYLLGKTEFKHRGTESIPNLTGLSEDAAEVLQDMNEFEIEVLERIITSGKFRKLLAAISRYAHKYILYGNTDSILKRHRHDYKNEFETENLKFVAVTVFSQIIDDIYEEISKKEKWISFYDIMTDIFSECYVYTDTEMQKELDDVQESHPGCDCVYFKHKIEEIQNDREYFENELAQEKVKKYQLLKLDKYVEIPIEETPYITSEKDKKSYEAQKKLGFRFIRGVKIDGYVASDADLYEMELRKKYIPDEQEFYENLGECHNLLLESNEEQSNAPDESDT